MAAGGQNDFQFKPFHYQWRYNLLDLSVIFVTLPSPRIEGEGKWAGSAHFLFVAQIYYGFEWVTGEHRDWPGL